MAERRMFAKTIIDSDAFLDMPLSAQCLYFHLNMRADDDGFINNPKKIQRMVQCSDDDLKLLIVKNFIIPFESGIVVIKHWKIHNYIRNDRYKKTVYQEEKKLLYVKDNNAYSLGIPDGIPSSNHPDVQLDTQVRLGKDRLGKVNYIDDDSQADKPKELKTKYADYVKMKEKEYAKLVERFGTTFTDKCIEVLDNYKGSKGVTYKDDYRAILSWVVKRVEGDGYKPNPNENERQEEILIHDDIFTDEEYIQIMRGKMSKEEQLRIVKERTGENNV